MAAHVERGTVPGAITLVSRRGEVHVDVIGKQAVDGAPLRRDSLFRISSMTKPITAVGALTLVEECVLRLDDPVDDVLPELAGRRVLRTVESELEDTVPANRAITLRDLLTFRLGFGMLMGPYPIVAAANERSVAVGPPNPAEYPAPDEWLRRLGELPLMAQPGEKWLYHTGSDVLGVLLERVSGKPLDEFLGERVFEPLGMKDTAFFTSDVDRLVMGYHDDLTVYDPPAGQWSRRPEFLSGGAGLLSTVDDLSAFAHMMLSGGGHVLSRPTVELMTTDQLTPAQKAVSGFFPGYFDNRGWGFGVSVATAHTSLYHRPGRYGWDGGLGTSWQVDPGEELTGILLTQCAGFPDFSPVYQDFWTSVYQAIED
ncbi:beta-lactamase family protein [Amycolatopsis alkalitolerans]|uniref:Beta-lactamase family protein n=2 Tax=Amycolatopsis alkalitolerans TaxID=2547244 RepID=A0A5C4LW47_9PSEU|nr:beta-lactamase family protein [Amycolatopsis alkalitolerans]